MTRNKKGVDRKKLALLLCLLITALVVGGVMIRSYARAKGKRLGRPRVAVDAASVRELRAAGASWPEIAKQLGVSVGSAYAAGRSPRSGKISAADNTARPDVLDSCRV